MNTPPAPPAANGTSSVGSILFIIGVVIASIVISLIVWYISGSVLLSLGLLFILFIIGLIIYYFFLAPPGFFGNFFNTLGGLLSGGGGSINTNCTIPEQNQDITHYVDCVKSCAVSVGNCANDGLFSCDRKAVAACELQTCKSTCFPDNNGNYFLRRYGIGQDYGDECVTSGGRNNLADDCFNGCTHRTGTDPSQYCPCMDSNCADVWDTCNFFGNNFWRTFLSCPT